MADHLPLARLAALLLAFSALPAAAQKTSDAPPERMVSLMVFGDDPCPRSTDNEIVVCARLPENERYRIPKRLRGKKSAPAQESWANTARELEYVSRVGTPNSCSPVGSGGQTGCYQQFLRAAREERRHAKADDGGIP
jgi:hypothetical protein